jgi:Leucine-rich repeat (LRR) protein
MNKQHLKEVFKMKKFFIITIFVTILLLFASGHLTTGWAEAEGHSVPASQQVQKSKNVGQIVGKTKIDTDFGNIPLYFIPNKGQMDQEALFCAKTSRYNLWLTKQGLVFDSIKKTHPAPSGHPSQEGSHAIPHSPYSPQTTRDVSRLIFLNANQQPVVVPQEPTAHRVNYLKGKDSSQWHTQIPTSKAVYYKNLYKKIDLKVYGLEKQIEYDWVVKPGADPGNIRFQYQGVKQTSIDKEGNLVVETTFGKWVHRKPRAYQLIDGKHRVVDAAFAKQENQKNTYGFKLGDYNRNEELIIDPLVAVFSTYLGGSVDEIFYGITVAGDGSVYVAGMSISADYPTVNALQGTGNGLDDGVISKFTPDGSSLVFSTYLGGSDIDYLYSLLLGSGGTIYVAGFTGSTDFPTANPYQGSINGLFDGIIAKLSADGSSLLYSTYLGGSDDDYIKNITLDGSGAIYVTGNTYSSNFPLQNPYQGGLSGSGYTMDAFITKLSPAGSSLVYSTYLGGTDDEWSEGIAVAGNGEMIVAGTTSSVNFPTYNAYQHSLNSWSRDCFVTRFTADGSSLVYSTYLGGSYDEQVYGMDMDGGGAVYLVGNTPSSDFPTTPGAFQETKQGGSSGFVAKFAVDGLSLAYSTYINGTDGSTYINAIKVDNGGSAYVAGGTSSLDFPVLEACQYFSMDNWENYGDAFVTRFTADGSNILFSSYLGGILGDYCNDLAVDAGGAVYLTGSTSSDNFPTANAYQGALNGTQSDGFVTKLIMDPTPITVLSPNGSEDWMGGTVHDITWDNNGLWTDVALFYSTDNGDTWNFIDFIPDTGTYSWTVPYTPSTQCLVKVEEASGNVSDVSDGVFTISPLTIAVTSPNGNEDWVVTSIHDITWIDNGTMPNVSIDYSTNGGGSWIPVATSIPNTNSYSWTIPDTVSANCLVRVGDPSGTPADTSDGPFTISPAPPPFIEITSPNGTEVWVAGSSHDITWNDSTTVPIVSIDYSTDGGSNWIPVAGSITNVGSYTWTIPDTPSTNCLVKVTGGGGTPVDTSDAVFTIDPSPFPISERDALIALYNSTNGDNWTRKDNWRHPSDPTKFNDPGTECTWRGVTCNIDNTHVEEIVITNNNLTGTIPDLGTLTGLKKLNLESNNLTGNIPATLNNLTQLTHLSLSLNNLYGSLPDLGALTQLTWFSLSYNNLSGSIPTWLNNLSNLQYLFFNSNSFSGTIPDLSGLTSIESLSFTNNYLTGTIPTWLNNLVTLKSLGLAMNQLTGTIPDLGNLLQLETLGLNKNQLTGAIPTWINNLTQLKSLYLCENQLSGPIPDLSNLTGLIYLQLNDNQLTGPIPNLVGCTQLNRLYLSNNQLSGSIPSELGQVTSLYHLFLNGNQLTGSLPGSLLNLTNLSNTYTDFRWNGVHTDDQGLRDFLNSKQIGGDWESTQTIAPTGVFTSDITETSIKVSWTPITYLGDTGGYNVYYSTTPGSGYVLSGTTADKTVDNYTVTGLADNTVYYFVVEAFTDPHTDNQNTVTAEYSTEVSAATLEILNITVITPNGSESWEGNTIETITWSSIGTINDVKIEYSTDNGAAWNTVTASTPNSGSYPWTVPNTPSGQCLVKITDIAGPTTDTSDGIFTILEQRTVTVTTPNGAEQWLAGNSYDITWTSTGAVGTVSIDYSIDNGSSWNSIVSSTSNTGTYNWTVPDNPSTQCLVRISDTAGPAVDVSNAVFTISPRIPQAERDALIALYNSTNGDSWYTNSNWRKPGDPAQFNDPGTEHTWYGVTCNAEKNHVLEVNLYQNGLAGTIPDLSVLTQLITLNLGYNQLSGNIPSSLNNLSQLTVLNLKINQLDGAIPDLSNLTNLVELYLANNYLNSTIPAWLNNFTNLTVLHLQDNAIYGPMPDLSNLTNLSNLNLGNNQLFGDIPAWLNNFTGLKELWLYNNYLSGVIPDLSNLTQLTHLSLGGNSLTGVIPASLNNLTNLQELFLSANSLSGPLPDLSNLTQLLAFSIVDNDLTGSIDNITVLTQLQWLSLDKNQFSGTIPAGLGNLTNLTTLHLDGNMLAGEIPGTLSNLINLDVSNLDIRWNRLYTDDPGLRDFLNSKQFGGDWESTQTIAPGGVSTGEETHNSVKVSWTPIQYQFDSGGYRVYYSTTSGSAYQLARTINDKTVDNFTVTGLTAETTYYFVVESFTDPHTNNENTVTSEYSTEVSASTLGQPTLAITAPNGGQSWEATTSQIITWNSTGNITDVLIEYSTDNGAIWNTVTASTPNNGSYNWTVPNTPSSNCLVKIADIGGLAEDPSDMVFTIAEQRTLTVTAPNGAENWEASTNQTITWNSTGSIANVKIEYSTDSGGSWNIIAASTPNNGSYSWTVPNTPSNNCLVKVSDTAGPASDSSNAVFTIAEQRTITVNAPNGGQRWFINSDYSVTWATTGSISNVMIEYSINNGSSWSTVVSSTTNSGSYNWTIPNTPSNNCLVRISDTSGPAVDVSNGVFTIDPFPTLTVQVPNGGQSWVEGNTETITWTYTGTIATVDIEYSANGGTSWNSIASSTANTGSYNWVIPAVDSGNCLVRVSDTATTASDVSDTVFALWKQPSITVTAPDGGETWVRFSVQTITWTTTGNIQDVKIQYSDDAGVNWTDIVTSTPNNGSYQWNVPNVNKDKTQCLVKIMTIDGTVVDTSNNYFTISKF